MRHKKNFNHLGRKRGHRKAMLSNMASSLIIHKRIKTTTAKAKALKTVIEPLITKSKNDTTHARREAFRILQDKEATNELFREVSVKVGDRPGGYTRIIKLGARLGDNAEMCIIELVDYNENMLADKAAATKSTRRRRGGKKKTDETTPVSETTDAVEDVVVEEEVKDEAVAEEVKEDVSSETSVKEDVSSETSVKDEAPAAVEEVVEEKKPSSTKVTEDKEDVSSESSEKDEAPAAEVETPVEEVKDDVKKAEEDEEKKAE